MKKSLDKLINVCNKISQNQYMTIIFQAFTPTMPLLIICSMFMIFISENSCIFLLCSIYLTGEIIARFQGKIHQSFLR